MRNPENNKRTLPHSIIIGGDSYVGSAVLAVHRKVYPETSATSRRRPLTEGLISFNLAEPDPSALNITTERDALFLAAVSIISDCEKDPEGARQVNVNGTLKTAQALYKQGVRPVFFSTDYVFDGKDGQYTEDSPTAPITEYGRQKAEVEHELLEMTKGNALIIRLGKVFSLERGDGTLLDEMATLLLAGKPVLAATDQILCPVLIEDVVTAVLEAQRSQLSGVLHACSDEPMSRYDIALNLACALSVDECLVKPIVLDSIGMGGRPKNTSMRPLRLKDELGFRARTISECIRKAGRLWRNS